MDDEYVIYRTAQQHMSYLVEFYNQTDSVKSSQRPVSTVQPSALQANMLIPTDDYSVNVTPATSGSLESTTKSSEVGDEQDQEAGLMSKGSKFFKTM